MSWVPIAAWGGAVIIAAVVLGFCGYEIVWKANRLRRDLGRLQAMNDEIVRLQARLVAAQDRAAAANLR